MHWLYPLRAARGSVDVTPTNHPAAALFNNDTARLIRVWMIDVEPGNATHYKNTATRLTNQAQGTIRPLVTGEGTPVGLIDTDDLAAVPSGNDFVAFATEPPFGQGNPYPIAILRQGQLLQATADGTGVATHFSFLWDWVYPDELISPAIGDPAIDRRARP